VMPLSVDCETYVVAADAISALRHDRNADNELAALHECLVTGGCAEGFIVACRSFPPLAPAMTANQLTEGLGPMLERANEVKLARQLGLSLSPEERQRAETLSVREREIHELLAQGLTNRQIARALFISEVTVKVHVRHIFDKLGVRSRVEAATRLPRQSR
jgi:DNA-binding NarL/FixJ family response regulator